MALTRTTVRFGADGTQAVVEIDGVDKGTQTSPYITNLQEGTHSIKLTFATGYVYSGTLNVPKAVEDLVYEEIASRNLKTPQEVEQAIFNALETAQGYIKFVAYDENNNTAKFKFDTSAGAVARARINNGASSGVSSSTEISLVLDGSTQVIYALDANDRVLDKLDLTNVVVTDTTQQDCPECEHWLPSNTITSLVINKDAGQSLSDTSQIAVITFGNDHLEFNWEIVGESADMFRGVYEDTADPNANPKYKVLRIYPKSDRVNDFLDNIIYQAKVTIKKPGTTDCVAEVPVSLYIDKDATKVIKHVWTGAAELTSFKNSYTYGDDNAEIQSNSLVPTARVAWFRIPKAAIGLEDGDTVFLTLRGTLNKTTNGEPPRAIINSSTGSGYSAQEHGNASADEVLQLTNFDAYCDFIEFILDINDGAMSVYAIYVTVIKNYGHTA